MFIRGVQYKRLRSVYAATILAARKLIDTDPNKPNMAKGYFVDRAIDDAAFTYLLFLSPVPIKASNPAPSSDRLDGSGTGSLYFRFSGLRTIYGQLRKVQKAFSVRKRHQRNNLVFWTQKLRTRRLGVRVPPGAPVFTCEFQHRLPFAKSPQTRTGCHRRSTRPG
jgi:hypothetical protein